MKGYSTREVARLIGLSAGQVRSYARAGLLTAARDARGEYRFSFPDLVLLRTAAGLAAARVPKRNITRALKQLRRQLPDGGPLSGVRITADGDRIVVRDGDAAWNPLSGQFLLDFQVSDLAAEVAPLAREAAEAAHESGEDYSADEWYDLALDLEACAPEQAVAAYERALTLDGGHADANINLGRMLQEAGRLEEAVEHYRRALERTRHPTAWFNLGTALEDLGRVGEALESYGRALAADPGFADAHYNLARIHEIRGERAAALRHLRIYRSLTEPGRGTRPS